MTITGAQRGSTPGDWKEFRNDDHFKIGDLVKVEADRGEDLGTLIHMWNAEDFADWLAKQNGGSSRATSSKYHKRMLRLATE